MQQENVAGNTEFIKSEVWTSAEAAFALAITEGGRVAAYFNDCGQVVICQESRYGDDELICFEHKHLPALICRLQEIAADSPENYYSDAYQEAQRVFGGA